MAATPPSDRRLLLIQFAGDFREADRLLRETGEETYYNHRHILETLAEVQRTAAATTIMCCRAPEPYSDELESGVTAVGVDADPYQDPDQVLEAVRRVDPTDIVFLGPMPDVIKAVLNSGARITCIWADSFETTGLRAYVWRRRIRRQLNDPRIDWVGNHGRVASRLLVGLGVDPAKIYAWDYTHEEDPDEFPARDLSDDRRPRLFFAGGIGDSKGVFDVVEAVALLRQSGVPAELRVAGAGETDRLLRRAQDLGIAEAVTLLGLLPNREVLDEMRTASAVVVPSWHEYPEGQPLTINEALRARTPIVSSDHPVFDDVLVDGTSAVVFPARDPRGLADAVRRLHDDPDLYRRLSDRAPTTWRRMAVDVKWGDLVLRWARNSDDDREWFAERAGEFAGHGGATAVRR